MISFTAPLKIWRSGEGSSHFVTVPEELAGEIKAHAILARRGFGSVKVEVNLHDVIWRTSIFPSRSGGYFLPIKIQVVRTADIAEGDCITISLELL